MTGPDQVIDEPLAGTKKRHRKQPPRIDICPVAAVFSEWDTAPLFDVNQSDSPQSAIDQFFQATRDLNILLPRAAYTSQLGHLVLLGHMSAVESYFRTMIRRVILIDPIAQAAVHHKEINYAAALHHRDLKLLPEALFERISFSSPEKILEVLKSFLGIAAQAPPQVQAILEEFGKVCQIRHCLVHRFGKLGSRNAVQLGLSKHSKLLEKPLAARYEDLQVAFDILRQSVTVINNHVFYTLVTRILDWKGTWRTDKRRFHCYYNTFATTTDQPASDQIETIYAALVTRAA